MGKYMGGYSVSDETTIVRCPHCGAKNRVPVSRLGEKAVCGRCKTSIDLSVIYPNKPIVVHDSTFDEEVARFPGLVLLDFHAPWCGHCRTLDPVMDGLAADYAGKVKIVKVNVDKSPGIASRHGVKGVPALYFYKDGKIVDQAVGALPRNELERRLNSLF